MPNAQECKGESDDDFCLAMSPCAARRASVEQFPENNRGDALNAGHD